jgi:uroporphyrinogen decarboxylase
MAITERENFLRVYKHQKPDHLPDPGAGLYTHHPIFGFLERPDDGGETDWFGVSYLSDPSAGGYVPNPNKPRVITDIARWREQLRIPDVDNWDWEKAAALDIKDKVTPEVRENKLYSLLIQCGIFERFHALLGMEEAYIALLEEPEESKALIDALGDYKHKLFAKLIEYYKPDIIRCHDDYGTQLNMQMSPELWRKLIKPNIARFVELCHSHGVFYEQHSCGMVGEIVPDLAEIGVDSWQGMHINDVPALMSVTKDTLAYHMGLNIQKYEGMDYAGDLTEEKLRADVRDTVVACARGNLYWPVGSSPTRGWWGNGIIADEIKKCREIITY